MNKQEKEVMLLRDNTVSIIKLISPRILKEKKDQIFVEPHN